MNRRRKRPNYFGWTIFGLVVLFGYFFNQVYLPSQPNPFEATPTATRSPESYVTEAEALYEDGKLLQAIDAYQSAINTSPQDPLLYIAIARLQVWAGQYEEAQANAENALLLSPNNSMAYAVHAWALDFQVGKNGDALKSITKALEIDPNNALAHAYYAEILVDTGLFDNYAKAADESRIAQVLAPDLLETHRARAYILSVTGEENIETAIREYEAAIAINPNIAQLHIELGQSYRALQAYEKAITEFTRANTLNPTDYVPDLLISRTHATTGSYAQALQYAETAVKDNPIEANLRGNYGVMYYRNFFYDEALEQLALAVEGGRTEDGLVITGLPLTDAPLVVEYYFTYGLALARRNQCGDALQIAQKVQTSVPDDENAVFAASEIIRICQEALDNPAVDTPTPGVEEVTPTP
ncbi:MAG: tetratricopeptide repeat protein [Anaerolineae bacterium]|nr:tetratricopeptide repeat protein [Anaerolineae bacterium]MCI0607860.1 tetratricopeptide repeat protein [Anaerolineae bacterium]